MHSERPRCITTPHLQMLVVHVQLASLVESTACSGAPRCKNIVLITSDSGSWSEWLHSVRRYRMKPCRSLAGLTLIEARGFANFHKCTSEQLTKHLCVCTGKSRVEQGSHCIPANAVEHMHTMYSIALEYVSTGESRTDQDGHFVA